MTIKELKAKGYKRYTAVLEVKVRSKPVEVYAQDAIAAYDIFANTNEILSANEISDDYNIDTNIVDFTEHPGEQCVEKSAVQNIVTIENELYYEHRAREGIKNENNTRNQG